MTFIQMTNLRFNSERVEEVAIRRDSQKQLLHKAAGLAAAVKFTGDAAMGRAVCCVIAIEQIKSEVFANLHLPRAQPDGITRQGNFNAQPLTIWQTQGCDRQLAGDLLWG